MIDLHSHVLPFVDDGSASVEQSVYLLNEAKKNGVTEMALTPHYRRGTCTISNEKIRADFEQFKNMSEVVQTGVKLWLGRYTFGQRQVRAYRIKVQRTCRP